MERIGRYRIERRIGAGSFATVWLGHDDDLDVTVAVKILAENWIDNTDVRNRFLAEARLMRRIRDERIVGVHDVGTLADGRPYFVMDYCDAGSLNDLRRNPTDPARTLRLCAEACQALNVLHGHRVVHRDVTPGNLLLDTGVDGAIRVRLADLGVAKEMIGQQGLTMTAGTPAYMAPEQATGHGLDARADVYAMACVAYAVLTGAPPFAASTVQEVQARREESGPAPVACRVGAPAELDDLLQAALSIDPDGRPATAAIMGRALDRIADAMVPQDDSTLVARPDGRIATPPTALDPAPEPSEGPPAPSPESSPASWAADLHHQWPDPAGSSSFDQAQFGPHSFGDPAQFAPTSSWPPFAAQPFAEQPPFTQAPMSQGPVSGPGINPFAPTDLPQSHPGPVSPTKPGWQFWALVAGCGLLVFLGVLFLTLALLG